MIYVMRMEQWEQQAELEEATEGRRAEVDHNRASSPDLGITKSNVNVIPKGKCSKTATSRNLPPPFLSGPL